MRKVNLNNPLPQDLHLDYYDKQMALLDNVHQVPHTRETILNESFIIIMVEEGECNTTINSKEHIIKQGDTLICAPGSFLERGMVSIDFHCRVFIISADHIGNILKGTHMSISHYLMNKSMLVLHLSQAEQDIIVGFYKLITNLGHLPEDNSREQSIYRVMQAFAYTLAGLFIHRGIVHTNDKGTSAETLFRNFIRLLKEHPNGRTVQFYADKLNITPKYFNTICKQISGKTASTLINEEVVNIAQILLNDPDLSIKQISSTLGFTNQSHFGSFIRRETGLSPQALRKRKDI